MSFKTIVCKRDDGDYDAIAAISVDFEDVFEDFNAEKLLKPIVEFLKEQTDRADFQIVHLANVTDVIEAEYIEAKSIATWDYSLWTQCPNCIETVDLLDNPDFWHQRDLEVLGVATMQDVECPKCKHVFKCNIRNE